MVCEARQALNGRCGKCSEALRSFVKVAKFLQDLVAVVPTEHVAELKGGAYSLLRQGAAEAEELLQVSAGAAPCGWC
eukprot:3360155-Rhodomonas_salina.1